VYIVNEFSSSGVPTFGTLKRYDVVTGAKVEIVKLANTSIFGAQVSDDGQWLLFQDQIAGQAAMQLVRMDGQDLQTLYCQPLGSQGIISGMQWSGTQRFIVFAAALPNGGGETVFLLDVTNGNLQQEISPELHVLFNPRTWLDRTRVYLTIGAPDGPPGQVVVLDTSKGPNQDYRSLPVAFDTSLSTPFCWDFDSSFDATKLFVSQCTTDLDSTGPGGLHGPGVITVHPPTSQSYAYLFVDQRLAITNVRAVTKNTLLFSARNTTGDTSLNGLWKVGTDGTNPVHLASSGGLNTFNQFPWSNVSRDGSKYVLQIHTSTSTGTSYILEYGSMSGGSPTVFASITNVELDTVGWTTM
jgi:hypothetical protein